MATPQALLDHFTVGLDPCSYRVGIEVETLFRGSNGGLMTFRQSQGLFARLMQRGNWTPSSTAPCGSVVDIVDPENNRLKYDAGHANIELATSPAQLADILPSCRGCLHELYGAAARVEAAPYFGPIAPSEEDTLIALTPRDRSWLQVDGRDAFAPIARIASVQFTFGVPREKAIEWLNRLAGSLDEFIGGFPQHSIWRQYIEKSRAGYRPCRFGGPLRFGSFEEYCHELSKHHVIEVENSRLTPFGDIEDLDVPQFLRSVWWFFRLRRYGNELCIEIRPIGRWDDERIEWWLRRVAEIVDHPNLH